MEGGRDGWREEGRERASERQRVLYKYSRAEYLGAFADSTGQSVLGNEQDGATAVACNEKDRTAASLSLFDEQEPHHAVTLFRYFGTKREGREREGREREGREREREGLRVGVWEVGESERESVKTLVQTLLCSDLIGSNLMNLITLMI
jgi:hypothetical protein